MIYIAAEREACDFILDDLEPFREQCFVELSQSCMQLLISFGLAVAACRQSPEKLFALLDMYETMLDLQPTVSGAPWCLFCKTREQMANQLSHLVCMLQIAACNT